jgi:N-acetyl sugar amidotransferase
MEIENMTQRCTRCLYDDTVPSISFDENGVCNYCQIHDQMNIQYPTGAEGNKILFKIADQIKKDGRGKKYDVAVGVSGGCDSSYMLYMCKKMLGLRPLAVHFDNTWDSTIAVENIQSVLKALDVDLYTYVVDNEEYDDIYRSFFRAGVPEIDAPTDMALTTVLYMAAEKYGIKYIFEGHSFRTEGISPLGWVYFDGKYIESVQKKFGTYPLKSFPNLWMKDFIRWTAVRNIKRIRPIYYMDYRKKEAMALLSSEAGWEWYGGHHLENRMSAFCHTYIFPGRFNTDQRTLGYSALVRSGQLSREDGMKLLAEPIHVDQDLVEMVKKRLGFSDEEFDHLMHMPKHTWREFQTYKKTFERTRLFWWLMYKLDRVPKSFYIKYTSPVDRAYRA